MTHVLPQVAACHYRNEGTRARDSTWAVFCEKVANVLSRCHTKRRTGLYTACGARVIPKDGWARPRASVLLLV